MTKYFLPFFGIILLFIEGFNYTKIKHLAALAFSVLTWALIYQL